jgi:hypothetical protein
MYDSAASERILGHGIADFHQAMPPLLQARLNTIVLGTELKTLATLPNRGQSIDS